MPVASDLGLRGSRRAFAKDDNKGGWSEQAFSTDLHKVNFISPIGSEEVYPPWGIELKWDTVTGTDEIEGEIVHLLRKDSHEIEELIIKPLYQ